MCHWLKPNPSAGEVEHTHWVFLRQRQNQISCPTCQAISNAHTSPCQLTSPDPTEKSFFFPGLVAFIAFWGLWVYQIRKKRRRRLAGGWKWRPAAAANNNYVHRKRAWNTLLLVLRLTKFHCRKWRRKSRLLPRRNQNGVEFQLGTEERRMEFASLGREESIHYFGNHSFMWWCNMKIAWLRNHTHCVCIPNPLDAPLKITCLPQFSCTAFPVSVTPFKFHIMSRNSK